ncbi:MAG: hypothetical protein HW414_1371, partial [Dehalococcoidia bacterium]|nr:hypothetical protein [Dehalococcoidia bacterium]
EDIHGVISAVRMKEIAGNVHP